jgi:hypothetical protein
MAILKTIKEKIDTYSGIISKGDLTSVDFFSLITQRDELFEEYVLLYNAVKSSDAQQNWIPTESTEEL